MTAMHNCLKRIEIRLNRSEVTNYLSSIDMTPALQPERTVTIKTEPRNEEEMPVIVKTESLYNPEHEDLDGQVKGFNCPTPQDALPITIKAEPLHSPDPEVGVQRKGFQCPKCQLTFKYRLHLSHHQNTNNRCALQCNQINDVKLGKHLRTQGTDTHTSNSNAQVNHSCPKCKKEFNRSDNLRRHMTVHTGIPNRLHTCSKCLQRFKHEDNFTRHTQMEHLFKCEYCELAFPYKSSLTGHTTKRHRDRITSMSHRVGNEDGKLGKHLKTQGTDTHTSKSNAQVKHSCPKCKKEFNRAYRLRHHMAVVHMENPHTHSRPRPYVCSTCRQAFKHVINFKCHTRKEHSFKCEHCELAFPDKSSLDGHTNKCHRDRIAIMSHSVGIKDDKCGTAVSRRMLPCPECKKEFARYSHLQRHITYIHSNERPFVCSKCLHSFKVHSMLNRHIQKEHMFKCVNCELSFLNKTSVEAHALNCHPEEVRSKGYDIVQDNGKKNGTAVFVSRPKHSCPQCKKAFASSTTLQHHMTHIHSNERPFVCSTCRHAFKTSANLIFHDRKTHRFKCENCELAFVHKPSLEEHAVQYHQAVSRKCFSCPDCEKKFKKNGQLQLRIHMSVHSNEKPYFCSTCLHTFKFEHNLIGHTRKNHVFKCGKCSLLFVCQIHLTQHVYEHFVEKEVI